MRLGNRAGSERRIAQGHHGRGPCVASSRGSASPFCSLGQSRPRPRSHLKTHSLTRRRLFGCGRSRSRTRVLWPRCPRARPSGSTHAPKAGAASRFQSSPATCSRSSSARKRRKPRRHRDAAISTHRGNRSHRPHGQPIANRPGGLRPTAGTGRSASAARGRGRARIMAGWRSG